MSAIRKLYVPIITIALLIAANFVARNVNFNPLSGAQNARLMFFGPTAANDRFLFAPMPLNAGNELNILYIGNSQTYAVMDAQPGDRSMIAWLAELLNEGNASAGSTYAVRYGSLPNLTMTELAVKVVAAGTDYARRPDVVVVGVVIDSLRWLDPRADVAEIAREPRVRKAFGELLAQNPALARGRQLIQSILAQKSDTTDQHENASGLSPTAIEGRLQDDLERTLPLFGHRKDLYSRFVAEYLDVRNRLLRIDTSTRRPIPVETYKTNLEMLELTLAYLQRNGIRPILYIAPLRPLSSNPTDPADVARFRIDFAEMCRGYGATCLDYSNLVPDPMWTNYPDSIPSNGGQHDYAHFTGRGHEKLARQLMTDVGPLFRNWLAAKSIHQ